MCRTRFAHYAAPRHARQVIPTRLWSIGPWLVASETVSDSTTAPMILRRVETGIPAHLWLRLRASSTGRSTPRCRSVFWASASPASRAAVHAVEPRLADLAVYVLSVEQFEAGFDLRCLAALAGLPPTLDGLLQPVGVDVVEYLIGYVPLKPGAGDCHRSRSRVRSDAG
jgi:hypothetical protein